MILLYDSESWRETQPLWKRHGRLRPVWRLWKAGRGRKLGLRDRHRNRYIRTAAAKHDDDDRQHLTNQIRELRREFEENRGEIERL